MSIPKRFISRTESAPPSDYISRWQRDNYEFTGGTCTFIVYQYQKRSSSTGELLPSETSNIMIAYPSKMMHEYKIKNKVGSDWNYRPVYRYLTLNSRFMTKLEIKTYLDVVILRGHINGDEPFISHSLQGDLVEGFERMSIRT